jgi:hypothetical protein
MRHDGPVGDPDQPRPPRERWLRVVREGEELPQPPAALPPDAPPTDQPADDTGVGPPPTDQQADDTGVGPPPPTREPGTWARPAARQSWTAATAPASPPTTASRPHASLETAPQWSAPPRPRVPPRGIPPRTGSRQGAAPETAPRGSQPQVEVRPRPAPHVVRAVGMLVAVVGLGTGGAVLADRVVGMPGDGHPALYVLVALALPFWDALPDRLGPRIAVVAAVIAAVAAVWLGLSTLAAPTWWRAQVAFGVACLLVGTAHLVLAAALRRRTVAG